MSIYIKGMEMPKSCYKCPLRRRDGMDIVCPVAHERFSVADVNILDYRLDNCPLIPVPPHGRLIDADDFFKRLMEKDRTFSFHLDGMFVDISDMNELLSSLEPVIEAEGAEEIQGCSDDGCPIFFGDSSDRSGEGAEE